MTVVTRFAPSPTGFLHVGGAHTALFNWLFARHHGGKFLLRIEDTDRARSTEEAVKAILDGLTWLGLDWDGEVVSQFSRVDRHAEVARQLVAKGKAYYCYCTPEELAAMREQAAAEGRFTGYDGRWRDRDPAEAPAGVAPAIRLKAPREGETVIDDLIQGTVRVANDQMDDMVLLRADGTPTYMLAVVVDDHDMEVTHAVRGDDHFTNAFRQTQIYQAMGWQPPIFAHMPLIHGPDGKKLSKRHGAVAVGNYADMGFLPEAMRNYLLRLGWSHGDDEIISTEQAIEWFGFEGVLRSPARFDMAKLTNLNGHYIRQADDKRLADLILPRMRDGLGADFVDGAESRVLAGMKALKERAKTLVDLADSATFFVRRRPLPLTDAARALLDASALGMLADVRRELALASEWKADHLEAVARAHAEKAGLKLGKVAQPIRAALTGATVSPPIFAVMQILGPDETLGRLDDVHKNS
ncbi:MAG: glutamate--tRNA ligase [Rhodospirillales bacterium]|jgi:glutamyl-tRNA synthetase|nr:glutamate--tRNA ligase [Rhodospirillales bacterium]